MPQNFIKFYGNDWRSDPRLRECSAAARGVWIDLLTFMAEAEPFGHLLINGKLPTPDRLAALTVTPLKVMRTALAELEANGVFSRTDDGVIYSRRMLRDARRSEEGRRAKLEGLERSPPSRGPSRNPSSENPEEPSTHGRAHAFQKPEARSQKPPDPPLRGSEAARRLVAKFRDLRRELWPNEPDDRLAQLTLETEADQFLAEGATEELCSDVIDRGMRRSAADGKTAPRTLRFFNLSMTDAIAAARKRSESGSASAQPSFEPASTASKLEQDRERVRRFLERGTWLDSWGFRPGDAGCVIDPRVLDEFRDEIEARRRGLAAA